MPIAAPGHLLTFGYTNSKELQMTKSGSLSFHRRIIAMTNCLLENEIEADK